MRKIACLPDDDRRELFRNTADKMGLNDAIVEKDFWVMKNEETGRKVFSLAKSLQSAFLHTRPVLFLYVNDVPGYFHVRCWVKSRNERNPCS